MDSLQVHIDRYEELVRRRGILRDLVGHQCITTMSEFLSMAEPERICWSSLGPGLMGALAEVRGDIHKQIKDELEAIARLLYQKMRPEVDRLVDMREERRRRAEVATAIEAEKRARYDRERAPPE